MCVLAAIGKPCSGMMTWYSRMSQKMWLMPQLVNKLKRHAFRLTAIARSSVSMAM
jgi:protoheme ferro-lyase